MRDSEDSTPSAATAPFGGSFSRTKLWVSGEKVDHLSDGGDHRDPADWLASDRSSARRSVPVWDSSTPESRTLTPLIMVRILRATAIVAAIGDGSEFKNCRHLAAWVGLVPRQFSSVRRQSFWVQAVALVCNVMPLADGAASGDWRLSVI